MDNVQPTPPPCDREVFERGVPIFVTNTLRSHQIEAWVKRIAERCGQRVDWHFAGGRAIVLALGDVQWARDALHALRKEHDDMWIARLMEGPHGCSREYAEQCCASLWGYAAEEMASDGLAERARYMVTVR